MATASRNGRTPEAVRRVAPNAPLLSKPFRAEALDKAVRGALAQG